MVKLILLLVALAVPSASAAQARLVGDLPRKGGKPLVELVGVETEYGVFRTSDGTRLRTIVTRPAGASGPLPAMMLTQWVSCGSLDVSADKPSLMRQLAEESHMVFVRVERSGTGDSEGAPCSELDYDTEVRHYRDAFDQIVRHRWVDPKRILLFGSSLGATTAPLVAAGKKVAGIAVQGGGALTYLERMIHFDRLYLERSGKFTPAQLHEEMNRRIAFHVAYLLERKTPEQVERDSRALAGVWKSIRGGADAPPHYGRPYRWHWQAASKDFLEAWSNVQAPVLVVYGEFDQFETRQGHKLIADTLNRMRSGSATFIEIRRADHDMDVYASAEDAYAYRNGTFRPELLLEPLLDWARRVTAGSRAGSSLDTQPPAPTDLSTCR
jgi:pimeloyl-ACP methyl ester carboxylesterase